MLAGQDATQARQDRWCRLGTVHAVLLMLPQDSIAHAGPNWTAPLCVLFCSVLLVLIEHKTAMAWARLSGTE